MAGVTLDVPYLSQIDPATGGGGANCGPATLAMALAYRGTIAPTQGAMWYLADIVRDGVPDNVGRTGGYTTLQQLVAACAWFDQRAVWIGTWAGVVASLAAGEPVVLLVDNTALDPRQYPRSPAFDAHHFILLTGADTVAPAAAAGVNAFAVNDPLRTSAPGGPGVYTGPSVRRAAAAVGGVQAIALEPWAEVEKGDDVGITDELFKQVADLQNEVAGLRGLIQEQSTQIEALREELAGTHSVIGSLEKDTIAPLRAELAAVRALLDAKPLAPRAPTITSVLLELSDGTAQEFAPVPKAGAAAA